MDQNPLPRPDQTRLEIVQAARRLFVQQGYHGTSMRQIAKEAGVALGGIYNHFPSKEAIFETVFLEYHPYLEVLPALLSAEGNTLEELVRSAAARMLAALEKRPDFLHLMFIEVIEFKSTHTNQLFARIFPDALKIVDKFAAFPGRLRSIPPPILVRSFIGLFFSFYMTGILLTQQAPPDFSADGLAHFVDIYLHGILAQEG